MVKFTWSVHGAKSVVMNLKHSFRLLKRKESRKDGERETGSELKRTLVT